MKIKFNSDDNLPLTKPLRFLLMAIIIRCVFSKNGKFYPQRFFIRYLIRVSIKMLWYQKIDVAEGIDVNKTCASKECEICHYCFFKDVEFKLKNMFIMDVMIY